MGAEEFPSVPFNSNAMDNAEYTDTDLVFAVRKALASVQNGDTDDYSQLKTVMCLTEDADFDAVAQLETVLKSLSVSVAWIDLVHHKDLLEAIFKMSLWYHSHRPSVMDALVDLIISLAATSGKYLDPCLNMLSIVTYVDNLLRLENSSIGEVVGSVILMMVMERMLDLDLVSGCDDSNGGMFDMELEDAVESTMNEGDEFPVGALKQNTSGGNVVSELLDKLMVLFFHHLESCQNSDRLDEVFEILFKSFENYILNTYKTKFSQFLMFYACSLDPENCGVRFASKLLDIYLSSNTCRLTRMSAVAYLASYLSRGKFLPASFVASMLKRLVDECAEYCGTCNDDVKPEAHQVFYSGCQAILYVLCFRMRSIVEIPRFQSQFRSLESILSHKLNPLLVCLPSVVSEFLKQAKAGGLFIVSESFIFDDLHESELSRAFGGFERLDTFFPFDPCLLKMSSSYISPNFNFWSMVKTTYGEDGDEELCDEVIVNGDADSAEEPDDDVELDSEMNTMSTTPKHSFMRETERLLKMPSRIRPSTSPPESFLI
ncbi:unnamed protein product [Arabidopsis thaliana]|uniref:(thale cress) hypothetical protein n=1 Tax=Arabidopsis thaliana TaxID=3702 RepID=A0A7G2DU82_ARATH|nr:unnamed protein product [Arabidopsis thaliana]